ncbi:MAG TPA: MerR family transcriptional regulator [Longimicrobiales bacterium]|nr:MerR family transcriptional regulator [Longimicrobiales bacterium]
MEFPWEEEADSAPSGAESKAGSTPDGASAEATSTPGGAEVKAASEEAREGGGPDGAEAEEGSAPGGRMAEGGSAPGADVARPAAKRSDGGARPVVRKEYYAISEVSELVGLPAHVLRYWESQFSVLNPSKNRSGNRVYQRKEIKLILLVKKLLHDDKYTVEGAKQKLEQLRRGGGLGDAATRALDDQMVVVLRDELQALNELLQVDAG